MNTNTVVLKKYLQLVETLWSGEVAIDVGHLKKDQKLSAHCAIRFDFEHGKIIRQVNYDCYEPFA